MRLLDRGHASRRPGPLFVQISGALSRGYSVHPPDGPASSFACLPVGGRKGRRNPHSSLPIDRAADKSGHPAHPDPGGFLAVHRRRRLRAADAAAAPGAASALGAGADGRVCRPYLRLQACGAGCDSTAAAARASAQWHRRSVFRCAKLYIYIWQTRRYYEQRGGGGGGGVYSLLRVRAARASGACRTRQLAGVHGCAGWGIRWGKWEEMRNGLRGGGVGRVLCPLFSCSGRPRAKSATRDPRPADP